MGIVVGTMANLTDVTVKTFTVGFEDSLSDKSWATHELAEYHDTDHIEYTVTPKKVRDAIFVVLDRLGELFVDQSIVLAHVVAKETIWDVKVALSGDGVDELFAGYSRYRGEYYSNYYRKLPNTVRNSLTEPAINALDVSRDSSRGEPIRKARKFTLSRTTVGADRRRRGLWSFHGRDPAEVGRDTLGEEHDLARSHLPIEQ